MSKVTGWTKNERFISRERAGNSLSKLCKVANRSFQGSIGQHMMCMCKINVSNISPKLLAVWKLLMRLEIVACIGASRLFIYNDATQSSFQQEAALLIFFSCFSLVGLFLLNLLILRDSRLTSMGTAVSCWCQCKWRQQAGALRLFNFLVMSGFQRQKVRILLKPYLICSTHHRPTKMQQPS